MKILSSINRGRLN